MPKVVGLSVSFCIKDIVEGKVAYDDVEFIVGGTRASDTAAWGRVYDRYCLSFWSECKEQAYEVLRRLVKEEKIYQPRLFNDYMAPKSYPEWWVDFWDLDIVDINQFYIREVEPWLGIRPRSRQSS